MNSKMDSFRLLCARDLGGVAGGSREDFWNDPLLPSEWDAQTETFSPYGGPTLPDTTVDDLYGMNSALGGDSGRDDSDYDWE